jgi:hypothetical protein
MKKHQIQDRQYEQMVRCVAQRQPLIDNTTPSDRNRSLLEGGDLSDAFV